MTALVKIDFTLTVCNHFGGSCDSSCNELKNIPKTCTVQLSACEMDYFMEMVQSIKMAEKGWLSYQGRSLLHWLTTRSAW